MTGDHLKSSQISPEEHDKRPTQVISTQSRGVRLTYHKRSHKSSQLSLEEYDMEDVSILFHDLVQFILLQREALCRGHRCGRDLLPTMSIDHKQDKLLRL